MSIFARINFCTGGAALGSSVFQIISIISDRTSIKPFSSIGWRQEHLSVEFMVAVLSIGVLFTSRELKDSSPSIFSPLLASFLLAAISFDIFMIYFYLSGAIVTILLLFTGSASTILRIRKFGITPKLLLASFIFTSMLILSSLFIGASYFGAGL